VDHLQAERLDEALEIMAYCAELHPAQARSHYLLGIVHQRRGETEEARARYRRALELEPGHQGATRRLAELDASG
jgi:Flp pilus assembly protein TadD